jgi:hypothetical protein
MVALEQPWHTLVVSPTSLILPFASFYAEIKE